MTKCHFCGGKVAPAHVETIRNYGGRIVAFAGIPAEKCRQCGEQYYEEWVVAEMDRLSELDDPPLRELRVPVYSISERAPA